MSKLEKYIKESVTVGTTTYTEKQVEDILKVWPKVAKECREFIRELKMRNNKDNLLYRGSNRSKDFGRKKVRDDRQPKDMPSEAHEVLDDAFDNIYGWRARSAGLFCTGKISTAKSYGTAQIVFPVGAYEYLYSTNITDLYSYTDDGGSVMNTGPSDYEIDSWEQDYNDEYGEDGNGNWLYQGTSLDSDKDTAVDMVRDSEIESIEYDIEYEERKDEPDEDEIQELRDRLEDVNSNNWGWEISRELEWEPYETWEEYRDERIENYEGSGEGDVDEAENVIRGEYKSRDLLSALKHKSGTEIMVKCKEYMFFHHAYEDIILKILFDSDYDPRQESFDF